MKNENFYDYVIKKYKGKHCPEADLVYDMENDKDLPKKANDEKIFKYLDYMRNTAMCTDAADIYDEIKFKYLETDALSYYMDGNYSNLYIVENNLKTLKELELYGDFAYTITDRHIEKLKQGKILILSPNDEYNCFIKYKKEEE